MRYADMEDSSRVAYQGARKAVTDNSPFQATVKCVLDKMILLGMYVVLIHSWSNSSGRHDLIREFVRGPTHPSGPFWHLVWNIFHPGTEVKLTLEQ